MVKITQDEWLLALRKASSKRNDAGMTSSEIADAMGVSMKTAYIRLKILSKAGKLVVGFSVKPTIIGGTLEVPVYRIKA
jgi:predicted transcriptional regulator